MSVYPRNQRISNTLVSCPRNTRYFAGGQLAVFQGASEAPISESYGSSEQRGKAANWPRPRGWQSKWVVGKVLRAGLAVEGAYLDRYVTDQQRSRRLIFIATLRGYIPLISGTGQNGAKIRNVWEVLRVG
jgi:hypothetical protein